MLAGLKAISSSLSGHYWTLEPFIPAWASFRTRARRVDSSFSSAAPVEAAARPWSGSAEDARFGRVYLSGQLNVPLGATRLLLAVHGLGGNSESQYLKRPVRAAASLGWACLRLNMRGADGSGEDFYHAALTADLHAALASPELSAFNDIYVLGYSLGGHLALRFAAEAHDPRVRSVAAVCSPLDLARSASAIDRPFSLPYRHYVLRRLKQSYAEVAQRRRAPTPLTTVLRVRSIRHWDACTVVPRYGFESTADYYERASAMGRLGALRVPALLVNAEHDPMVPAETVRPALANPPPRLDVRWLKAGGHVGFPLDVDLGERAPRGLERQIMSWLSNATS